MQYILRQKARIQTFRLEESRKHGVREDFPEMMTPKLSLNGRMKVRQNKEEYITHLEKESSTHKNIGERGLNMLKNSTIQQNFV